ncbi:MAG: hypothetical protein ACYC35_00330 [Pirellulales bacterium]
MTATATETRAPFTPTAVLITAEAEWTDSRGVHVDPDKAIPLHLDSEENSGWLYTREEWEQGREARIYRRYGNHEGLEESERVELLPDLWLVKIDEREHWVDPTILDRTSRIYGVYVFDRRQHVHCCSFDPTYELTFLGSQWESSRELTDAEDEELADAIREGDAQCEDVSYWGVHDIDRMTANTLREGCLPTTGSGGMKITGVKSVVTADAIEEIREAYCQAEM